MNLLTKQAIFITLLTGVLLSGVSWWLGKENAFLLFNHDLGSSADIFFTYWTYAGDGIIWVPVTILVFIYKRRYTLLVLSCIVFSTLFTQLSKNVFFEGTSRPSTAITDHSLFHNVEGVDLHKLNSFPSGHTTTAFTIFLLATILINRRWVLPVGFLYAAMAAYSRVYLAQHFPLDLAGGMLAAVLTVWISVPIQRKWVRS